MAKLVLNQHLCPICGGVLKSVGNNEYKCEYCGKGPYTFKKIEEDFLKSISTAIDQVFYDIKNEQLANLRHRLYELTKIDQYCDSNAIKNVCEDIKKIVPADFFANFYLVANSGIKTSVNEFIDQIDIEKEYEKLEWVVEFMLRSLQSDNITSMSRLLEKAKLYAEQRNIDDKTWIKLVNKFEAEVLRVNNGVYDVDLPRDVFIAYSSKDIDLAYQIVNVLEANDMSCFIATRNLQNGSNATNNYQTNIQKAIDNSTVFLFISTNNSRSKSCDAYDIEMQYIMNSELLRLGNITHKVYEKLGKESNKKPRIEFLVDKYTGTSIYENTVKSFFKGYTYCKDVNSLPRMVYTAIQEKETTDWGKTQTSVQSQNINKEEIKENHFIICPSCEAKNSGDAKFCSNCGRGLVSDTIKNYGVEKGQSIENLNNKISTLPATVEFDKINLDDFEIENGVLKKYNGEGGNVIIPEGVIIIGEEAFYCVTLTNIILPDSVEIIKTNAFWGCDIVSITIGKNVHSIEFGGFNGSVKIVEVINKSSLDIKTEDDVDKNGGIGYDALIVHNGKSLIVEKGEFLFITIDGVNYLVGYIGKDANLRLPDYYNGASYEICDSAFSENEKIESVIIGKGVTDIGWHAFHDCEELSQIKFFDNIKSIGAWTFGNCAFTTIVIPEGVKEIGERAFMDCYKLRSITIPNSVVDIGDNAFSGCKSLETVIIPEMFKQSLGKIFTNVDGIKFTFTTKIKDNQTQKDVSKSQEISHPSYYHLNSGVNLIELEQQLNQEDWAREDGFLIQNKLLKKYTGTADKVEIPDFVTDIDVEAFKNCKNIESIVIPKSVLRIAPSAFKNCKNLTSIVIPGSVQQIGEDAFWNCKSLVKVVIPDRFRGQLKNIFNGKKINFIFNTKN